MPPMVPWQYILFQIISLVSAGFLFGLGFHIAARLVQKAK